MKVSDLITHLKTFPQDMNVVICNNHGFGINIMSLERAEMDETDHMLFDYGSRNDNTVDVLSIITY